jgi:uncharacterized protein (UPF0333 family)
MSAKPKSSLRNNRHKNLAIASLLIILLFSSFTAVYLYVANNRSDDTDSSNGGIVHVKSEGQLVKAINTAKNVTAVIIILDNDIDLTETINIPAYKKITLTSNGNNTFKIVGADYKSTLSVQTNGILILDGIVVTHKENCEGRGVFVTRGGQLFLLNGKISGNAATSKNSIYVGDGYGGGVYNQGVFTMSGGEISGNKAITGGGVSNLGTFTMSGGEISGNKAYWSGGGVYNWQGIFNRSGGTVTGNSARQDNSDNVYNETYQ